MNYSAIQITMNAPPPSQSRPLPPPSSAPYPGNYYSLMMSTEPPPNTSSTGPAGNPPTSSSDIMVSPLEVNPTIAADPVNIPSIPYHIASPHSVVNTNSANQTASSEDCRCPDPHHTTRQRGPHNESAPVPLPKLRAPKKTKNQNNDSSKPQSLVRKRRRTTNKKSSVNLSNKTNRNAFSTNCKVAELLAELPGMEHIRWESVLQSTREPEANETELQKRVQEAETLGARLFGGDLEKLLSSLLSQHLDFFVDYVRTTFDSPNPKHRNIRDQLWMTLKVLREQEHEEGDHSD